MEARNTTHRGKRIMVVDDSPVILKTLSFVLKARGYEVIIATGGPETLSNLNDAPPDLILLDLAFAPDAASVGGPLRDGFLLLQWLRRTGWAVGVPIIIISGSDPESYKERAEAADIVACFHKPINRDKLLKVIEATFDGKSGDEPPAAANQQVY